VNRLTALQREAARLLFGLPESADFALAGGSALVALGMITHTQPVRQTGGPPVSGEAAGWSGFLAGLVVPDRGGEREESL